MKEQMKIILQQQQEYEYLKQCPSASHSPEVFHNAVIRTSVLTRIKEARRQKKWKKLMEISAKVFFYCFAVWYLFNFIVILYVLLFFPSLL